jgi:dTDP-4-amino-4,6-dideoxygalactose transaminase
MGDDPPIRIFLSPPDVGEVERKLLLDAFDSNWIAPLGPHVDAFEADVTGYLDDAVHTVALASGTAALHLALLDLGVRPGDEVVTSTLTFAATANAITYVGATPVFVDVDPVTWQLDPDLVAEAIRDRAAAGRVPAAAVTVDLYGICADHAPIRAVCDEYGIPVIEDAAEALGSRADGRPAGTFGDVGVFSFNGNKVITTSGGGMLVTRDGAQADRIRHLASQARDPAPHYEHSTIGFNYRLSNLLAAVGRGQLQSLDAKVARRREVNARYRDLLGDLPGIAFLTEPAGQRWNSWLTCLTIDPAAFGASTDDVRVALRREGIEARPVWKPMHLQPVFAGAPMLDTGTSARLFAQGLCLPSGSALTDDEVAEVATIVRGVSRTR